MESTNIISESNNFIMKASFDLGVYEQKLILTLVSMIEPEDEDFKMYEFDRKEFMDLVGLGNNKANYKRVLGFTKNIMSKNISMIDENGEANQYPWLIKANHKKGNGVVRLQLHPDLKEYFLDLQSEFTRYRLEDILALTSKVSPRIFRMLMCNQFKKQGYFEVELDELRCLLSEKGVDYYPLYYQFKKNVLEKSRLEILERTGLEFTYQAIKKNNKTHSIKFIYLKKKQFTKQKKTEHKAKVENSTSQNKQYCKINKNNKFINFKQRDDIDFDEIERLERLSLEQELLEDQKNNKGE